MFYHDSMTIIKRFLEWIKHKQFLHEKEHKPPFFKEGEFWWAYVGENIGSEVDGKGEFFTRPIVIYKKLGSYSFLAIPTSTKKKEGTWYVNFLHKGVHEVVLLSQIRVLSFKRLKEKIGTLDDKDFSKIKEGFKNLYVL